MEAIARAGKSKVGRQSLYLTGFLIMVMVSFLFVLGVKGGREERRESSGLTSFAFFFFFLRPFVLQTFVEFVPSLFYYLLPLLAM